MNGQPLYNMIPITASTGNRDAYQSGSCRSKDKNFVVGLIVIRVSTNNGIARGELVTATGRGTTGGRIWKGCNVDYAQPHRTGAGWEDGSRDTDREFVIGWGAVIIIINPDKVRLAGDQIIKDECFDAPPFPSGRNTPDWSKRHIRRKGGDYRISYRFHRR